MPGVAYAERQMVFTGEMALRVGDLEAAMADARAWVGGHQGFVASEEVAGEGAERAGFMTLRVPQAAYEATRSHLRQLVDAPELDVLTDASQVQDVTGQYADLAARRENLAATERELRALLTQVREQGGGAEDILSVFRELTEVRGQIESLQAQIDTLADQVALSTLQVRFVLPPASVAVVSGQWQPGEVLSRALADAAAALQGLANVGLYLLGTAPFWLVLLGLVAAVGWLLRRVRRRARAPGPPSAA
jgi:hypothetical protein